MCVDYRMLNKRIIKDLYVLFRIEDILDIFFGFKLFLVFDMKLGYYQVEIEEVYKYRIVFIVGLIGFYEFNCLLFGLFNSLVMY